MPVNTAPSVRGVIGHSLRRRGHRGLVGRERSVRCFGEKASAKHLRLRQGPVCQKLANLGRTLGATVANARPRGSAPPKTNTRLHGWAIRRGRSIDLSLQEGRTVVEGHTTGGRRLANRNAPLRGCMVRSGTQCLVVPDLDCGDVLGSHLLRTSFGRPVAFKLNATHHFLTASGRPPRAVRSAFENPALLGWNGHDRIGWAVSPLEVPGDDSSLGRLLPHVAVEGSGWIGDRLRAQVCTLRAVNGTGTPRRS